MKLARLALGSVMLLRVGAVAGGDFLVPGGGQPHVPGHGVESDVRPSPMTPGKYAGAASAGLARAFERAAEVARRPALSGQCAGANRASANLSGLRFRERTARAGDEAASSAAMMANSQLQTSSVSLLAIPGLRICTASLDADTDRSADGGESPLRLSGDFNLIEDNTAASLESVRSAEDMFGIFAVEYSPIAVALGRLNYESGIGIDTSYSASRRGGLVGSTRQTSLSARQGLRWSWAVGKASLLGVSATQTASRILDATVPQSGEFEQSLRLSWHRRDDDGGRMLLLASLAQSRMRSRGHVADSSGRGISLLGRYEQPLSASSSVSADLSMLKSLRRATSPTAESLFSAVGGNAFQSTASSFRSAGASYRYAHSFGQSRLLFTAGFSAYRSEVGLDSFGLVQSRFGRKVRATNAGIDYLAGPDGPTVTVQAKAIAAGEFSLAVQFSKKF